jgi:hypothetical protein
MSENRMNESEFVKKLKSLPRSIRPQRDLWPGIEDRLSPGSYGFGSGSAVSNWRMPAMAAAVFAALTTGIFIGRGMEPAPSGTASQSVLEYAMAGAAAASEREYQAAFRELLPVEYTKMHLTPDSPDALRESWEDLQMAEASLLAALRQYPSNIYLNGKLLDLRSQQLQFIKQLALLEQNNWRKT